MVTVIDYVQRTNADGESFYALILKANVVMVRSKETGHFYATSKTASLPSTLSEKECENLLGKEIPGTIQRKDCEPYETLNQDTGEVIVRDYRYEYIGDEDVATEEDEVFEEEPKTIDGYMAA